MSIRYDGMILFRRYGGCIGGYGRYHCTSVKTQGPRKWLTGGCIAQQGTEETFSGVRDGSLEFREWVTSCSREIDG